jgi:cytochrome oxidase Cu insertion factor (SCO1/SenC/PrrC family)
MVHLKGIGRTAALAGILLSGPALVFAQVSGHDGHDKTAPAEAAPATASSHGQGHGHGQDPASPAETPAAGHGGGYGAHSGWPEPGKLGGDFSLTDHTGRKVTLADFKGKATALYFGYTQCGDICPIIGTKLGMAVDLMGDKADQVNIAMISVDDRNDGPAQLAAFVAKQHPRLIGLSGTRKEIYDIAALYRVRRDYVAQNQVAKEGEAPASGEHGAHGSSHGSAHAETQAEPDAGPAATPLLEMVVADAGDDTATAPGKRIRIRSASDDATRLHNMAMAHTTHIYLLNKEGRVVRYIYPSLTPEQLAKRLTDLAQEG